MFDNKIINRFFSTVDITSIPKSYLQPLAANLRVFLNSTIVVSSSGIYMMPIDKQWDIVRCMLLHELCG